ncbi:Cell division protein FtsL [Gammaproteobacteria bacterium]
MVLSKFFIGVSLVIAVAGSAMEVVYARHVSRKLYNDLQKLQVARDNLQIEWGKLQIEEGTWATHPRVERVAHNQLEMLLPPQEKIVVITP